MDASVLLRRGNKIIMGGRGMEGLGKEREGGMIKGVTIRCGRRLGRTTECQEVK